MKFASSRYSVLAVCVMFFMGVCASSVHAVAQGPTQQLRPTLERLVEIILDPELEGEKNREKRRRIVMEVVKKRFDFDEMSKRVLGSTWRGITSEEREAFVTQMTKLLENNYIGQLENYSGQTVEYVDERIRSGRAQVSTVVKNDGNTYPVYYVMRQEQDKWMVYDVNIEGVSLIRNYRAQFKSILHKKKFEGLLRTIEEKNQSF
ncbi:MAG: phospholipid-binding protein MlaC [Desulfopila sp.]